MIFLQSVDFHVFGGRSLILVAKCGKSCADEIFVDYVNISDGFVAFAVLAIRFGNTYRLTVCDMRFGDEFEMFVGTSDYFSGVRLHRKLGEACYKYLERLIGANVMNKGGLYTLMFTIEPLMRFYR